MRSTSVHEPSACCTGNRVGLPRLVVPRIVPPWPRMPRTIGRVIRMIPPFGYCSGWSRPLKPSRMPTTSQPRFSAATVDARMTALRPGASPPPVLRAIRRIGPSKLVSADVVTLRMVDGGRQMPTSMTRRIGFGSVNTSNGRVRSRPIAQVCWPSQL